MTRRFVTITAVVPAIAAVLLLNGANTASAHTSEYCGHGRSGITNLTIYMGYNGYPETSPYHQHEYFHDMLWGRDHVRTKDC
jgi:hypothetical protein